jgi:hypothetical protein
MTPAQKYENDQLDIYALTETDFALDDYIPVSDTSASGNAFKIILNRLLSVHQPAQGRLTILSGNPVAPYNLTAATTLYYSPYIGGHISIYDGTRWILHAFSEISLNISAYTANKNYDIWIYSNSGSATLDSTVWTSDTARATALTLQDGVYVKSGDTTRRYLGTIRITGSTGQCEDSYQRRFVWNYYNRLRQGGATWNTNASWTYGTAAWRESNGGTGHTRFEFVLGVSGESYLRILHGGYQAGAASVSAYNGTMINGTTSAYTVHYVVGTTYLGLGVRYQNPCRHFLSPGYNYLTQVEYATGANGTFYDGASYPYRLSQFEIEG